MKKLLLLFAALLVAGCGEKSISEFSLPLSDADIQQILEEAVTESSLEERDGLSYLANESTPYTGWVGSEIVPGTGSVTLFKEGVRHGVYTEWSGGVKLTQGTYKEGKKHGVWTLRWPLQQSGPVGLEEKTYEEGEWLSSVGYDRKNGQKIMERIRDKGVLKTTTTWHQNGEKESETAWNPIQFPDKEEVLYYPAEKKEWYDGGQKRSEETQKDGRKDGLHLSWHKNGRKQSEATYKHGKLVSAKYWNIKGEEVDTFEEAQE